MLNRLKTLPEDWLATGIGLLIVLVIGGGMLGPGAQNASLKADPGETVQAALPPLTGWQVSIEGADLPAERITELDAGAAWHYRCSAGQMTVERLESLPEDVTPPGAGKALVLLQNDCEQAITLNYRRDAALRWPIFGLLGR